MREEKIEKTLQARNPIELGEPMGIGGEHPAWDIIIRKLDYQSQMKISQQNQRLAEVVEMNAASEIRKYRRHIQKDKYIALIYIIEEQDTTCIETRAINDSLSSIATLAKAEVHAKKIQIGTYGYCQDIPDTGYSEFIWWDWKIKCDPLEIQLTVVELSTGKKNTEEWLFLPNDWKFPLTSRIIFARNFALIGFDTPSNTDTDDLLILNLVTRKQLWMQRKIIVNQIKEHVVGLYDLSRIAATKCEAREIYVGNDGIIIKFYIEFIVINVDDMLAFVNFSNVALGADLSLKFDDQNEVNSYEVDNVVAVECTDYSDDSDSD